jgi:hypothetical protein
MGINPHIRFGISRSGRYILDFIPREQIHRYLYRLKFYSVNYEVVTRKQEFKLTQQKVCYILFFHIEKKLIDKLKEAYGFIDKREYSIQNYKDLMCFFMEDRYVIAYNNNLSHQMKNYLNQHIGFTYKLIIIDNNTICMPKKYLLDVIIEDINNSIGITNEQNSDEETRKKLLNLRNLIYEYKEITGKRYKQPIFDFGGVPRY